MLVLFLDAAKAKELLDRRPPLFRAAAQYKSSRALLTHFVRVHLRGPEQEVWARLSGLGYNFRVQQREIEVCRNDRYRDAVGRELGVVMGHEFILRHVEEDILYIFGTWSNPMDG